MMNIHDALRRYGLLLPMIAAALVICGAYSLNAQPQPVGTQKNLDSLVNSASAELVPVVSPDGNTLYFDRKNAEGNTGGFRDPDDIYYSRLQSDGTWGKAVNIGPPLNTPGSDVLFWLSADGNTALVYHGKKIDGKDVGLSISRQINGKWTEPRKISIEGLDDLGDYYYAHMSPDGKRLFISYVDAPERDARDFNIFMATSLSDDYMRWSAPMRLGPVINTQYAEGAPFMAADNRTLYFISNKPGGIGQSDIYVTRRQGNDWQTWTKPVNLGPEINTPTYEAGFSIPASGDWLYTSRTDGGADEGFGRTDLYRLKLPDSMRPEVGFLLKGEVVNAENGFGVSGLVIVTDESGKTVATSGSREDGSFGVVLIPGKRYKLEGSASGFLSGTSTVDVRRYNKRREYTTVIELEPTTAKSSPVILFGSGSAALTGESRSRLKRLFNSINPLVTSGSADMVTVVGHTDSLGTDEDNLALSERRAETVKRQLIQWGIPTTKINAYGRGEDSPVATNGTSRGRSVNRRVEVSVEGADAERTPAPRRE